MLSVDYNRRKLGMGANSIPSWSIWQVKSVEGAEAEITCQATGDEDTFSTISRTHVVEQVHERLPVQQPGTKQRRYSSVNEKLTPIKHLSQSTLDINDSCSSNRAHSASSDSDLQKRRKLRKLKDATIEISTETKRFLSTMKYKLLNRRSSRDTPIKQIHLLQESDANRWASKPITASNRINSRTGNSVQSHRTIHLHVPQDADNEYISQNRSDAQ